MSATSSPKSAHNKPSGDVENLFSAALRDVDPEINEAIKLEFGRQRDEIELIASENIVSRAVLEAQGSVLTNKYAEGLPGKRYYGGCQFVDIAERLAIERASRLFGCKFANVQPHSGASANAEVFYALMQPGDTFMGLNLAAGGHLTHRSPANMSGERVKPAPYGGLVAGGVHPSPFPHAHVVTTTTHKTLRGPRGGVILSDNEEIAKKLNSAVFPGMQGGPLMHVIAAKAVAFGEALRPSFRTYARNVVENAKALPQTLKSRGLDIVSGGTDTHLMLVDLRPKQLTGKVAELALGRAHITCNKNGIPFDPEKPTVTSGIRLGTPARNTRGAWTPRSSPGEGR